MPTYNKFIILS
ncbi:Protein of unknown function [Bacillus cereus]|nr:Protein of unknown function [Bacillus cereus]